MRLISLLILSLAVCSCVYEDKDNSYDPLIPELGFPDTCADNNFVALFQPGATGVDYSSQGYLITGSSAFFINKNGKLVWRRNIKIHQAVKTKGGNFWLIKSDGNVIKLNQGGQVLAEDQLNFNLSNFSMRFVESQDEGFGLIRYQNDSKVLTFEKWDENGELEWQQKFFSDVFPRDVKTISNGAGGYYLLYNDDSALSNFKLAGMDSKGNILFEKRISLGSSEILTGFSSELTSGGCFFWMKNNENLSLEKYNFEGQKEWGREFNFTAISNLISAPDGFVLTGHRKDDQESDYESGFLLKISSEGEEQWSTDYGKPGTEIVFQDLDRLDDGFVFVAEISGLSNYSGVRETYGKYEKTFRTIVVRTNEDGVSCNNQ